MCGIAGIATFRQESHADAVRVMVRSLAHRGPDDVGYFEDPTAGSALGMARLSIVDIEGGHQPMSDEAKRFVIVFNGEIYNFRELWAELTDAGHTFATDHSDTEVILHGFEEWGDAIFGRLDGMFAVAIWDRVEQTLTLARDRAGEKPLYVGRLRGGGVLFGSELKALLTNPALPRDIDAVAVEQFLAYDFIIGPRTILQDVSKLSAGHVAHIDPRGITTRAYWSPAIRRVQRSDDELLGELDSLLRESVARRMVADVPVGLFLSGGLDSTAVGYYMAERTSDVTAFSIGFEQPDLDESVPARLAARHLGLRHELQVFTESDVLEVVPKVTELLDEPMGDPSIFPTFLLSQMTRQQVKVALGGDGSDELFMGYKAYQILKIAWLLDASFMGPVAKAVGKRLPVTGPRFMRRIARAARGLQSSPEERLLQLLGSFGGNSRRMMSSDLRAELPSEGPFAGTQLEFARLVNSDVAAADRTVLAYLRGYLQEDILVKVDRASMAASLEVRSPFLSPKLMDFALSIPAEDKMRGLSGKAPLRRLLRGKIPDNLIDRRKQGFGAPLGRWLRGPLRPLVRDYLSDESIKQTGLLDESAVQHLTKRIGRDGDEFAEEIWVLLQLQMWHRRWIQESRP